MVERYRPGNTTKLSAETVASFQPVGKRGFGVGRASIKKSTLKQAARDEKDFRRSFVKNKDGKTQSTKDGFQNFSINVGIGTNNALSDSTYGYYPISRVRTLLDWIHRGTWMGGIAIDLLAEDMTRGGVEILTLEDPLKVEKMQQALTRLKIFPTLGDNIKWSQLYGGSIAVLLIDGQDPSTPLRLETVGKNKFKGLTVFDRWMVDPDLQHLVSEYGPHLGEPEWYTVVADAPVMRGQRIHYTRVVRLEGVKLPYWQKITENLWGISVFERLYDRMVAFDSATLGASQLVYKSYLRTYKLDGLHDAVINAGDALQGIQQRVELMRKYQSIEGMTLLDSADDFATHETGAVAGIAEILIHFAEQLSGALQIPLVRLLGQSPAGLNSTGESDLRTYYDNILQRQERDLREGVNLILRVTAQSLGIKLPDNFNFNFVPLWQMDQTEKTEVADKASRFVLEVEAAGLVSPRIALQELRQLSKLTGFWTNIDDKALAEASDVAEPPEPDMGMPGEGGEEGGEPGEGAGEGSEPGGKKPPPGAEKAASERENREIEGLQRFKKVRKLTEGSGDAAPVIRYRSRYGSNARDGAYSMPFTEVQGIQIVVEYYPGTIRRGEGWSVRVPCSYGYVRRVGSAEGDEEWLDALVGPYSSSRDVWVVDSANPETGAFDEHKLCFGFNSERQALDAYSKLYGTFRTVGGVTHFRTEELAFKDWLANGDKYQPLAMEPGIS